MGFVFVRVGGERLKFGTLCLDEMLYEPIGFRVVNGRREATGARIMVHRLNEWRVTWEHSVVLSAVNPSGTSLGLVVFEQLSSHNVTVEKAEGGGWRTVAQLVDAPGFTEWSDAL